MKTFLKGLKLYHYSKDILIILIKPTATQYESP